MWKKAFIILLGLNLLVLVAFTVFWGTLPKASQVQTPPKSTETAAPVELSIGQDAINAYLEYALSEQADLSRVLAYARVSFDQTWEINLGVKLYDRVVPVDLVFTPEINNGNLWLHIDSGTFGQIPLPVSGLVMALRHAPWPNWIHVDDQTGTLRLNFSERPQNPYGIQVLGYDPNRKMLTARITIIPRALLKK